MGQTVWILNHSFMLIGNHSCSNHQCEYHIIILWFPLKYSVYWTICRIMSHHTGGYWAYLQPWLYQYLQDGVLWAEWYRLYRSNNVMVALDCLIIIRHYTTHIQRNVGEYSNAYSLGISLGLSLQYKLHDHARQTVFSELYMVMCIIVHWVANKCPL